MTLIFDGDTEKRTLPPVSVFALLMFVVVANMRARLILSRRRPALRGSSDG